MRRSLVLLVLPLALLGACGDDEPLDAGGDTTTTTPAAGADDLDGRTFVAAEVTEGGEPRPLVAGTELRLAFAGGQVAVQAGCNHLSATYERDGDTLHMAGFGGTEMGCDPERMEQDAWVAEVLARPTTVALDGATLTLTAGDTTFVLTDREVASPDAELVGPTWTLDTLIDGTDASGTASSVPAGVVATLTLAGDGTYEVATGCNSGSGTVEVGDGTATFAPPALTRRACEAEAAGVEAAILAVLDGEVAYEITEGRLTLTAAGAGLGFQVTTS